METESPILAEILVRLKTLGDDLRLVAAQKAQKDWYTTAEVAERLDKAEFTVREWCRLGRIGAQKRNSGRGKFMAWVVGHAELLRFEREGLLQPRN